MRKIFEFFVSNYKFTFMLTFIVAIGGLAGLGSLTRETFPPVDFARVTVTTIYPGASAEEIEEKITNKIEDQIRSIEGIKDVRSTSQDERSEVDIRIDIDNADTAEVVADLQRAIARVQDLPPELLNDPELLEFNAKEIPIAEFAIIGPNENRERDELTREFKERLEDITGVASVRTPGFRNREFQILIDPGKLRQYAVGIPQVVNAVRERVKNVPAGYVRSEDSIQLVRLIGQVKSAEELAGIQVRTNEAFDAVKVGDLAKTRDGSARPSILAGVNGQPATLVVLNKKADADAVLVAEEVKKEAKRFEEERLKKHKLVLYNDESRRINNRLTSVTSNALQGLIIVIVVLMIFLPGKIGLVSAMSLPLAVLATTAFMALNDANFNVITTLALIIALGMLVDNAIVVSESYAAKLESGMPPKEAAIEAAHQFWIPITASVLTTVAAFLPMLVTKGVLGEFIRWIPIVVTGALLASLFESFFLLPARLQMIKIDLDHKKEPGRLKKAFDRFENWFGGVVTAALKRKYLTLGFLAGAFVASLIVTVVGNRFELFPKEGVEFYVARVQVKKGTALEETDRILRSLAEKIEKTIGNDKIKVVISRAGIQQAGGGDPLAKNGEDVGVIFAILKPEVAEVTRTDEILNLLKPLEAAEKKTGLYKDLSIEALAGGPPVGKPLNVVFRSSDKDQLKEVVDKFKGEIEKIEGTLNVFDDVVSGVPELRVDVKHEVASFARLSVDRIGLNLRSAYEGLITSRLTKNGDEVDVRVRLTDEARGEREGLNRAAVLNDSANLVPLSSVADIKEGFAPETIKHFNYKRSITVTSEVEPEKITSVALNARAREILKTLLVKYPSVSVKFGGEDESTKESFQSLLVALLISILGIFAILVFMFSSYSKPFLILTSVPLGLIGVMWAFFLHQRPLSFFALIGVIGLGGVVVNSAIILVDYIEEMRRKNPEMPLVEVLIKSSKNRLRPIAATGVTTIAGLMPTAYGIGGKDPILIPLTLAMAWGLTVGSLLSLIWIPTGYLLIEGWRAKTSNLMIRMQSLLGQKSPVVKTKAS